jgi:glycosyltransferase involved in cell wall biosynthesis
MLEATLAGIRSTTRYLSTEIIVVDDGSVAPIAAGSVGNALLLRHPEARGTCDARRKGALLASGDVFVWLDAHMAFGEHWLEQMLVQAHADNLVCSPFWTYDLKTCMCWGSDFMWNSERDWAAAKTPGFAWRHRVDRPDGAAVEVPLVIGACYAMTREAHDKLGGLCPHFKCWGIEELDMSARCWMAGMRVVCATHAQVGHYGRVAFPYAVLYDDLEFNQLVMIRSLFDRPAGKRLEEFFRPFPEQVAKWLDATDLGAWRKAVGRRRKITDDEFFRRFLPEFAALEPPPKKRRAGKGRSA